MGAIVAADVVPAAVFLAEIVREVAEIDELVGKLMRIVVGADDDVGAGADIGGDRRFGAHVLSALGIETNFDARLLGEPLGARREGLDVVLDELLPAQHSQLRTRLRRVFHVLCGCGQDPSSDSTGKCGACTDFYHVAPCELGHCLPPNLTSRPAAGRTNPETELYLV